jgi:hypothetical protein
MTKNWKKFTTEKKFNFFWDEKVQYTYSYASIKNVQVTEEAFISQKRTSTTSKHVEMFSFFSTFCIFARLNPDPIRIRIH